MSVNIFTPKNQAAGELAVRNMTEKAIAFCHTTDPFVVYEYTVIDGDGEKSQRYAYAGCMGTAQDLTFGELVEEIESMQDMINDEGDGEWDD